MGATLLTFNLVPPPLAGQQWAFGKVTERERSGYFEMFSGPKLQVPLVAKQPRGTETRNGKSVLVPSRYKGRLTRRATRFIVVSNSFSW